MRIENHKQKLIIPKDWIIINNEFNFIDLPKDESELNEYVAYNLAEDLLYIKKGQYHLDLGWYGSDIKKTTTGFMLVLFRGKNWNDCELLELKRSESQSVVIKEVNEIIELVDVGFCVEKIGYFIDEDKFSERSIGQHLEFSIRKNINELMR